MKKFYFIIICLFSFVLPVLATPTTYERNENNHYGVNKKWSINDNNLEKILKTPYVNADERIYDFANILDYQTINSLNLLIEDFEKETGFTFVFISTNNYYVNDIDHENYAVDFYDYNDFGINDDHYSGVLLYRNATSLSPYYALYTFGDAQLYFDNQRINEILDSVYNDFILKNYSQGIDTIFKKLNSYYDKGIDSRLKDSYINDMGHLVYKEPFNIPWILAFIIAIFITSLFIWWNISKQKMVIKANDAKDYLYKPSINFSFREDKFINSHTTSHHINTSSSRGSGGSRIGSSGGGHCGGGRRG